MRKKNDKGESANRDLSRDEDVDATTGSGIITSETTDDEAAEDRDRK